MTTIDGTLPSSTTVPHRHELLSGETPGPLPPPEFLGDTPSDALSEMLLLLERSNQSSLQMNLGEIKAARERMVELRRQLADELKRALEAARKSQHKKKGWFGRTFGKVIDVVARVVGKQAEAWKDAVVLQGALAISMARHMRDREALLQSLRHDLLELSQDSKTEHAIEGFAAGTAKFMGDLASFQFVLAAALTEKAVKGEALHDAFRDALKDQAEKLWNSAETNILENPDFWTVTGRLAQGAAVASAVASGGALAPVAVGLIIALEVDHRYGYLEEAFGKKAAPWIRLGLNVAAAASSGASSNQMLRWTEISLSLIDGAGTVHRGVRDWQEGKRQGEALDRQTDMQETLFEIQQTQRLMDALIDLYAERSDYRTRTSEASAALVETQGQIQTSLVLQG